MPEPQSLAELVRQLQEAEIVPRPEAEACSALVARISFPGRIAEIDEETYWCFLGALPPKYRRGSLFAFAEGAEPLRLFWQKGECYLCRQLTWSETQTFCGLADISLPS